MSFSSRNLWSVLHGGYFPVVTSPWLPVTIFVPIEYRVVCIQFPMLLPPSLPGPSRKSP